MLIFLLGAVICSRFAGCAGDVREALRKADIPLKNAALAMQVDAAQLKRELDGNGHLSLRRLALLPDAFWQWFVIVTARRVGVPRELKVSQRVRVARVALRAEEKTS